MIKTDTDLKVAYHNKFGINGFFINAAILEYIFNNVNIDGNIKQTKRELTFSLADEQDEKEAALDIFEDAIDLLLKEKLIKYYDDKFHCSGLLNIYLQNNS